MEISHNHISLDSYKDIIEASADMIFVMSPDMKIIYMNYAGRLMIGLGQNEDLSNIYLHTFLSKASLKLIEQEALPISSRQGVWEGEISIFNPHKLLFPVIQSIMSHKSSDGSVLYFSSIIHDISAQKELEKKLLSKNLKINSILNTTTNAISVINKNFEIIQVNDTLLKLLGTSQKDALGKKCYTLLKNPLCKTKDCALQKIIRGERVYNTRGLVKDFDGKEIDVLLSANEFLDADGNFIGIVEDLKDISDIAAYENELKHAYTNLKNLFESVPVCIIIVSLNKQIRFINSNALKLLKYDNAHDLIGKPCHEFFCSNDECPVIDLRSEIDNSERVILDKNKNKITVLKSCIKINYNSEDVLLESFIDISTQKKDQDEKLLMQKTLFQTAKLASMGELAGGVAHELNNPLAVIQSYSDQIEESLEDKLINKDDLLKSIDGINRSIKRMVKLIKQLKEFGRAEDQVFSLISLNDIIDSSFSLFGKQLQNKSIEIEKIYSSDDTSVAADKGKLEQVFVNLLINARDAMASSPKKLIRIQTMLKKGRVLCIFEDSGPGIPGNIKENIFNPFFTTKDIGKGTGLGLSISHEIISDHEGVLTVEDSETLGGAKFLINLPSSSQIL